MNNALKTRTAPTVLSWILFFFIFFSGAHKFTDVFSSAGSDDFARQSKIESDIDMDSACNIQFTSVRYTTYVLGTNSFRTSLSLGNNL